jgi:hypothetical protein
LEDCVNDLSKDALVMIEPKVVLHPQSYLQYGIESTSLLIEDESLNPLQSVGFQDPFWENFIRRHDRTIILNQPWLYDPYPCVKRISHSSSFELKGHQIREHPREPKPRDSRHKSYAPRVKKVLYLVNARGLKQPFKIDPLILALIRRKLNLDPRFLVPPDLDPLLPEIPGLF